MGDEIIDQVHAAKDAIAAKHGYDFEKLLVMLQATEANLRRRGVRFEDQTAPRQDTGGQSDTVAATRQGDGSGESLGAP